jgi:hypothetical protein
MHPTTCRPEPDAVPAPTAAAAGVPLAADETDGAPVADATVASGHESPQDADPEPVVDDGPVTGTHGSTPVDGIPAATRTTDAQVAGGDSPHETAPAGRHARPDTEF